ncbi:MAG: choline ABC transporter ATP-binding protein [Arenicella sp.]
MSIAVKFENVDVVFGPNPETAIQMLDNAGTRESILKETNSVIGVADANLTVKKGEICVLMGLSGSGKSSLLRCVNGLNKITRGKLLINHDNQQTDIASCDAATLKDMRINKVAMVFQQFGLLPWRTVRDNVGFGLEIKGMPADKIRQMVDEKLQLVHLEEWAEKHVSELSGGMQQRVGLARALCTDADILLMDEPFSALDPLIRDHLQEELLELQSRLKKTIIFVSHDLDEAVKLGNHIVIMDGGRIVQQGSAADIVFKPENDYVRQFVANMNPLQVLYAEAMMTPLAELDLKNGRLQLDDGYVVELDDAGAPVKASHHTDSIELLNITDLLDSSAKDAVLMADYETNMRELIVARRQLPRPILIVRQGELVGLIGEQEVYAGLLR